MRRWSTHTTFGATSSAPLLAPRKLLPRTRHLLRYQSAAAAATARVEPLPPPSPATPSSAPRRIDPYGLVEPQLSHLRKTLFGLVGSAHPSLTDIAEYYFLHPSKQVRPLIVLLMAQATNGLGGRWPEKRWASEVEGARGRSVELDAPLSRPDVLNDYNPNMDDNTASFSSVFPLRPPRMPTPTLDPPASFADVSAVPALVYPPHVLPTQLRLAQIVEMIHVASLLHDDVIDDSPLRRGAPSAPAAFGNKLAILGGDFLLGRASAALSRLGEPEVVELIASVIANLVEGEIMQMGRGATDAPTPGATAPTRSVVAEHWNVYLRKTYLKTATLMAKGARAAVILGGSREGELWKEAAYAYGRNLGIAFQLVDDVLDYEHSESTLGKPGGADLKLGLATGPALAAWEEHPEMGPLIARKFDQPGDVETARDLVRRSSGVERTRAYAQAHADQAREVLQALPDSDAKLALEALTEKVMTRSS